LVLVGVGFFVMFTYDSSAPAGERGRIVEGDAYNYLIVAIRGAA